MTNASCASCGRIVAFRTQDPNEEVECRGCGLRLQRSAGMLGVAVPVSPVQTSSPTDDPLSSDKITHIKSGQTKTGSSSVPAGEISARREISLMTSKVYIALEEIKAAMKVLEEGQQTLLDRTESILINASPVEMKPEPVQEEEMVDPFPTTAFSSPEVQVVPHNLAELEKGERTVVGKRPFEPVPTVSKLLKAPAGTRIRPATITEPMPFPVDEPMEAETPLVAEAPSPQPEPQPVQEPVVLEEVPVPAEEPSPFTTSPETEPEVDLEGETPFQSAQPLETTLVQEKVRAETREPDLPEESLQAKTVSEEIPLLVPEEQASLPEAPRAISLEEQILAAKEAQSHEDEPEQATRELEKAHGISWVPFIIFLIAASGLGVFLFFGLDKLKANKSQVGNLPPNQAVPAADAPLILLPFKGEGIPADAKEIEEASTVAQLFLKSSDKSEAQSYMLYTEDKLLKNFYEPSKDASIRPLDAFDTSEGDTVVRFLAESYSPGLNGNMVRLLEAKKSGDGPFRIDWKTYAECEEVTLVALTQEALYLEGETEDKSQARVRVWLRAADETIAGNENWQVFRVHDLSETTTAVAVVQKGSEISAQLQDALAKSDIRHRGRTAIQAILNVERIVPEDSSRKRPARLQILDVLSTDWN